MANYLVMFAAPEHHIEFMSKHSGVSRDYYCGEPPEIEPSESKKVSFLDKLLGRNKDVTEAAMPLVVPADWPTEDADIIDIEINHRNVDLYHWILNKSEKPVSGAGSIFQTWFHDSHDAISLDDYHEDFAFYPKMLPELLLLINQVTLESTRDAFQRWCNSEGKDYSPTMEDAEPIFKEFENFANYIESAIAKNHGLVWVVS